MKEVKVVSYKEVRFDYNVCDEINEIGVVEGLKSVVELLRKKIGGDEMDGENWVESINAPIVTGKQGSE